MRRAVRNGCTLKHVQTVTKAGRTYRYLRAPGRPRVPLPAGLPLDDPAFLVAYLEALAPAPAAPRAAPGTIDHAAELYLGTAQYHARAPGYRAMLRRQLDAIRTKAGTARLRDLRPHHLRADLATVEGHARVSRLKAWRALLSFAVTAGLLPSDPSEGLKAPRPPSPGHPAWTRDDLEAVRARWQLGTVERLAVELLAWTGARISDAVTLGPPLVGRDGVLAYRQAKTSGLAFVPWSCPLPTFACPADRDMALQAVAARPSGHLTWLATAAGRTRSHKALGHLVATAARAADVPKSAHGLRKFRSAALAELGATSAQIGAWTGHTSLSEVERYTRSADRRRLVQAPPRTREAG